MYLIYSKRTIKWTHVSYNIQKYLKNLSLNLIFCLPQKKKMETENIGSPISTSSSHSYHI